tara:strand:+ start:333 stop:1730 length:1398 start_codon:yes stop_codon:yes gene_type:complete
MHKSSLIIIACLLVLPELSVIHAKNKLKTKAQEWIPLFNGKDLQGWQKVGGDAKYTVNNGEIVGTTIANTPNTFLCTKATFNDFILEFEFFVNPDINSGVQFRSIIDRNNGMGGVTGYQFEIDPSSRAFSGGIYDEARRGWLYPLSRNLKGQKAINNGKWNHCRIEAIGSSIRTWINDIQCSNLTDEMSSTGIIALQVHSVLPQNENKTVRWRNIVIKTDNLESERIRSDPTVPELSYLINKLSPGEIRRGWRLLWDGKTSKGLKTINGDPFAESGWAIKNGVLTIHGSDKVKGRPLDIITEDLYSRFELELQFMISKGANSGIKYFVDPNLIANEGKAIGPEFQILDDAFHTDAKLGIKGNRTLGSLYDLIPAVNLSVSGRVKQFKGIEKWNNARIVVNNNHVSHWLNNEKVIEYDRHSQIFKSLISYSKYRNWSDFGQLPEGYILLQDHGNTVHFRSIKIKEY